jgi:sterol desaturase/sphingolipid hydroxylase (fatty acid hydroxylase superfamily)
MSGATPKDGGTGTMIASVGSEGRLRTALAYLLWPLVFGLGLIGTCAALAGDHPLLGFAAVYLSVAVSIGILERLMPFERRWLVADGETLSNLAHTLLCKGSVQIAVAVVTLFTMELATVASPATLPLAVLWPSHWPLLAQVVLGLVVAELGLYIAHRSEHNWPAMWRFHALHHSVERLWVVNTGRFHIVDTFFKIALSQLPLYLLGAPVPVFLWISAVTAFTGLLTHCNIDVRTGPLDLVFATPSLHRWHHSKVLEESNSNYGENLMIWDRLLGTYYNPPRRPPAEIGIHGRIASGFLRQLAQPFTAAGAREILGDAAPRRQQAVAGGD